MRRGLVLALLALAALAPGARADLRIYSSLPLQGDAGPQSRDVVLGMRLALAERSGQAGGHVIDYVSLDDSTAAVGKWEPGQVFENARRAARDPQTIAYLGEFNSGASAVSIPIINEAGILQISPTNTYVGLTRGGPGADRGEPAKYYPADTRTYGRVAPADHLQARAIAAYMRALKVKRLFIANDREVYGHGVAQLVEQAARRAGIRVVANIGIDTRARSYPRIGTRVRRLRADAFFFGGITQNHAARLWRDVARAARRPKLFGPDGVAESAFTARIPAAAARRTYITDPTLDPSAHAPAGQDFFARFRAAHGRDPESYAIFGYDAMSLALDSIERARPADAAEAGRRAVVDAFFATRDRDSVLGRYSIDANGDTTLPLYGGYRIRRGRLVFDRVIDSSAL